MPSPAATGKNPAPLLRFPFGDADVRTIAAADQAGYVPIRWTVDTPAWGRDRRAHRHLRRGLLGAGRGLARRDRPDLFVTLPLGVFDATYGVAQLQAIPGVPKPQLAGPRPARCR